MKSPFEGIDPRAVYLAEAWIILGAKPMTEQELHIECSKMSRDADGARQSEIAGAYEKIQKALAEVNGDPAILKEAHALYDDFQEARRQVTVHNAGRNLTVQAERALIIKTFGELTETRRNTPPTQSQPDPTTQPAADVRSAFSEALGHSFGGIHINIHNHNHTPSPPLPPPPSPPPPSPPSPPPALGRPKKKRMGPLGWGLAALAVTASAGALYLTRHSHSSNEAQSPAAAVSGVLGLHSLQRHDTIRFVRNVDMKEFAEDDDRIQSIGQKVVAKVHVGDQAEIINSYADEYKVGLLPDGNVFGWVPKNSVEPAPSAPQPSSQAPSSAPAARPS